MDWWLKIELSIESFQKQITKIAFVKTPIHFDTLQKKHETNNLFVTSKKRNHEFSNSPIHEFKILQNVFLSP